MNIMISYRRADSGPITGRIYDRLQAHFGADHVFIDIDSIPMGIDFRHHIQKTITRCDVLLPVIGPHWTGPGEVGKRRIDDPHDLVRLEVAHALERNIRVIPLLIEDASMPRTDDLPDDLKTLGLRNALQVDSGVDFHHHMNRLCSAIERLAQEARTESASDKDEAPPSTPISDVSKTEEAQKAPTPTATPVFTEKPGERTERGLESPTSGAQLLFVQFKKSKFYVPAIAGIALLIVSGAVLYFISGHPSRPAVQTERSETPTASTAPTAPTKKTSVPHAPLADGAIVQREELSPSGNIRVRYVRTKGNPVHQIIIESVEHPGESKVFFGFQRAAWILISPNDEWIALNNRPSAGHSELRIYHHDGPGLLDYIPSNETDEGGATFDQVIWNYYVQQLELSPDSPREGVTIDGVGWDPTSEKLAVTVTVEQADGSDEVPPPWNCVVDLATKEIEVTPEAAQAFNQQMQPAVGAGATAAAGQQAPASAAAASAKPLEGDFTGERYQETRTRVLTAEEISHWKLANIRYAIDEIYARRGADFSDQPKTRKEFANFAWYKPREGVSTDQIKAELSDVEQQNLAALEKSRKARSTSTATSKSKHSNTNTADPREKALRALKEFFSR